MSTSTRTPTHKIHISRRGSVEITPSTVRAAALPTPVVASLNGAQNPAARSHVPVSSLESSRIKLEELKRKSRELSDSLRRHEHVMEMLASMTVGLEAETAVREDKRRGSPTWMRYSSSSANMSRESQTLPRFATPNFAAQRRSPSEERAYEVGYKSTKAELNQELTVAIARDMAETRVKLSELQHSNAIKEVQLSVAENDVGRLRAAEKKYLDNISTLSGSVTELQSNLEGEESRNRQLLSRISSLENDLSDAKSLVAASQQQLATEQVERESLARRIISLTKECNKQQEDLKLLKTNEKAAQEELRQERERFHSSISATRREMEVLQREFHQTTQELSSSRAEIHSLRHRAEHAESSLNNLQQVHQASIEQLVAARERLKREQDARWSAESSAARLRGIYGSDPSRSLVPDEPTAGIHISRRGSVDIATQRYS